MPSSVALLESSTTRPGRTRPDSSSVAVLTSDGLRPRKRARAHRELGAAERIGSGDVEGTGDVAHPCELRHGLGDVLDVHRTAHLVSEECRRRSVVDRVGDVLLQHGQCDRAVDDRRADHDGAWAVRHDDSLGVEFVACVVDQRERLVGLDVRSRPAGEDDVGRHVDEARAAGLGGLGDVLAGVDDRATIGLAVGEVGDGGWTPAGHRVEHGVAVAKVERRRRRGDDLPVGARRPVDEVVSQESAGTGDEQDPGPARSPVRSERHVGDATAVPSSDAHGVGATSASVGTRPHRLGPSRPPQSHHVER